MSTLVNTRGVLAPSAGARHPGRSSASLFQRILHWVGEQRRYRRTLNELSALSGRELDDIGLNRDDIEGVARRSARIV